MATREAIQVTRDRCGVVEVENIDHPSDSKEVRVRYEPNIAPYPVTELVRDHEFHVGAEYIWRRV